VTRPDLERRLLPWLTAIVMALVGLVVAGLVWLAWILIARR
jgi:hypothetical protein